MIGPPTSPTNLSSASDTETTASDAVHTCCCDSCIERRFVTHSLFLSVGLISRLISLLIGVYVLVSICFVQVLVIRYVWQTKLSGSLVNFLAYVMHF